MKHSGDGKLMAHVPEGIFLSGEDDNPVWVDESALRIRGSAFTSPLSRGAPAIPNDANDAMHDDNTGFRCVASPEQMGFR